MRTVTDRPYCVLNDAKEGRISAWLVPVGSIIVANIDGVLVRYSVYLAYSMRNGDLVCSR